MFNKAMLKAVSARRSPLPPDLTEVESLTFLYQENVQMSFRLSDADIYNADFKLEMDIKLNYVDYNYNSLWSYDYSGNGCEAWIYNSGYLGYSYNGATIYSTSGYFKDKKDDRMTFTFSNYGTSMLFELSNGYRVGYSSRGNMPYHTWIGIGALKNVGSKYTIYGAKLWLNGELVKDLVPCIHSSDLYPCMYDKVSKMYYDVTDNDGWRRAGMMRLGPLKLPSGLHQSGDPYMYNGHGCVDVTNVNTGALAIYDLVTRRLTYYSV